MNIFGMIFKALTINSSSQVISRFHITLILKTKQRKNQLLFQSKKEAVINLLMTVKYSLALLISTKEKKWWIDVRVVCLVLFTYGNSKFCCSHELLLLLLSVALCNIYTGILILTIARVHTNICKICKSLNNNFSIKETIPKQWTNIWTKKANAVSIIIHREFLSFEKFFYQWQY